MSESVLLLFGIAAITVAFSLSLAAALRWYAQSLQLDYLRRWSAAATAIGMGIVGSTLGFGLSSAGYLSAHPARLIATLMSQTGFYLHFTLLAIGTMEMMRERTLQIRLPVLLSLLFAIGVSLVFANKADMQQVRLLFRIGMHYAVGTVVFFVLAAMIDTKLRESGKVLRNTFVILACTQAGMTAFFAYQFVNNTTLGGALFAVTDLIMITSLGAGMIMWLIETERSRGSRANADLVRLTHYDSETGLANQALLLMQADDGIKRAARNGLVLIDLDHFRAIGHSIGREHVSEIFHEIARRLKGVLPVKATLARLKHDTFAAFLPLANADLLEATAHAIHQVLTPEFVIGNRQLFLTGSVGLAMHPHDAATADDLLRAGLLAVNQCKSLGRGQSRFYAPELNEQADQRLGLIADLRRGLNEDQFLLHFQPIFDAQLKLQGFEALLRWEHPTRGLLPPIEFVASLDAAGISAAIDLMVLRKSLAHIKAWRLQSSCDYRIAVNISAASFQQANFPRVVQALLNEFGVSSSAIELEITESMALENLDIGLALLTQFKAIGVAVALDDFGTGYSSLSHLRLLPVQRIKVDRSFVRDVTIDRKDAAIVSAIIELAHSLDLTVVAEGVETIEQKQFLLAQGVDFLQGFLLAKPMTAIEAAGFMQERSSDRKVVRLGARNTQS